MLGEKYPRPWQVREVKPEEHGCSQFQVHINGPLYIEAADGSVVMEGLTEEVAAYFLKLEEACQVVEEGLDHCVAVFRGRVEESILIRLQVEHSTLLQALRHGGLRE